VLLAACGGHESAVPDACVPAVLYLNRDGGMWNPGPRDDAVHNLSVLVDAPLTLSPWPKPASDWMLVVECIRAGLAPFPLTVTEIDPSPMPHTEIVFTTVYWAGSSATTSIIAASCREGHQVEFVFGDALATRTRACYVALASYAQMIANLSFSDRCDDFVNNQADCVQDRTFVDATASCVDSAAQPSECRCGGTTQNSYRAMLAAIPTCE